VFIFYNFMRNVLMDVFLLVKHVFNALEKFHVFLLSHLLNFIFFLTFTEKTCFTVLSRRMCFLLVKHVFNAFEKFHVFLLSHLLNFMFFLH
jgi:hypothetical protein